MNSFLKAFATFWAGLGSEVPWLIVETWGLSLCLGAVLGLAGSAELKATLAASRALSLAEPTLRSFLFLTSSRLRKGPCTRREATRAAAVFGPRPGMLVPSSASVHELISSRSCLACLTMFSYKRVIACADQAEALLNSPLHPAQRGGREYELRQRRRAAGEELACSCRGASFPQQVHAAHAAIGNVCLSITSKAWRR